ncbi:MAG TPA: Rpn family recombination-promoting nuclease/putative transposase [Planctomycetaceae bacterium]|nr:Rpn family recombination-promoting nuclease/putative transposase [Planctomycetaceae bacterium]
MPLGIDPTVDYVFKRLFGDPQNSDLLIHLLNAVLQPKIPIREVKILNPFLEKDFDDDKLAILDIRACDREQHWFNIEMQTSIFGGLKERLVYYTSCLFSEQLGEGQAYSELLPSISICFLSRNLFLNTSTPHLRFLLTDSIHNIELTDRFQIHTIELQKYNLAGVDLAGAAPLQKWAFFLRRAAEFDVAALSRLLPEPAFTKATGVLDMISQTPEERLRHNLRLKAMRDRFSELEYNRVLARQEGHAEGREEGLSEGLEEGERIGLIRLLRVLQNLAKEPVSDDVELEAMDLLGLTNRIEQLQQRLGLHSSN